MNVQIEPTWKEYLQGEFEKPYFEQLTQSVRQEYAAGTCYPPGRFIFSVQDGVQFPPSLQNIFKEIEQDLGTPVPVSGNLTRWAEQGVLLLNATLTVRAHVANSHSMLGWQKFTDAAIQALAQHRQHLVYMLWGGYARSKAYMINRQQNLVLESVHPSPLSANRGGWFGQHQFSRCNAYLQQNGITPINW